MLVAGLLVSATAHAQSGLSLSTPLHWAAANGQVKLAQMLITNGLSVDVRDAWGRTPLHVGVRYRDVVELLLSQGASVDATDSFLNTPLHHAVPYRDTVELLITAEADVAARNTFGRTPLDVCLRRGDSPYNVSVAQMLVQAGAGKPAASAD
jgi:cytohesin